MISKKLDPYLIKEDFPILQEKTRNGHPLVYLDNGASSQKPLAVIEATNKYYSSQNANIHRGVYQLSQEATEAYERTRIKASAFFGAQCAKAMIFTRGTTESINLVANSWGRHNLQAGDEILLSVGEHHSNLVPWFQLAKEIGVQIRFLKLKEDTTLDLSELKILLNKKTKLVSITHMSNVTGTIHNYEPVLERARQVGAKFMLDGAQAACHLDLHLKDMDVDFYSFSAHKMLGPTGVGILYGKEEILEEMPPWLGGGDMIETVTLDGFTSANLPAKLEAGTPNIAGVIGFGVAMDYLSKIGFKAIREHEKELLEYALQELIKMPGLNLYGLDDLDGRGAVISFTLEGIHPHDVGSVLDEEGVAIRVGHHCCQPLMQYWQIPGTCRASFYLYNTKEDVDRLVGALDKVRALFRRVVRN